MRTRSPDTELLPSESARTEVSRVLQTRIGTSTYVVVQNHIALVRMARPVGRPRYDAKQKLIAAMRELLAERGYTATSPKMVLERAKLGQGSLYYHFTGKEELAVETIAALMHRSLVIVNNHLAGTAVEESDTWPVVQLSEEASPPKRTLRRPTGYLKRRGQGPQHRSGNCSKSEKAKPSCAC